MMSTPIKLSGSSAGDVAAAAKYPDEVVAEPGGLTDAQLAAAYYGDLRPEVAPSEWGGAGARYLGLSGETDADEREILMKGRDPDSGEDLVQRAGESRTYAYDLTFNAPKSVSIAWAAADDHEREAIEQAWDESVKKTLDDIVSTIDTRRGSGGATTEKSEGIYSMHRHGTARPVTDMETGRKKVDPHLHTHGVVYNLSRRDDGSWGTIQAREIYERQKEYGAQQSALVVEKLRERGYEVERDGDSFKLRGVDSNIERDFSSRRTQIEEQLKKNGYSATSAAAAIAVQQTREGKEPLNSESLRDEWQDRLKMAGFDRAALKNQAQAEASAIDRRGLAETVTERNSVVKETAIKAEAYRQVFERRISADESQAQVEAMKADGDLIAVARKDGHTRDESFYTTRAMQRIETRMKTEARDLDQRSGHALDRDTVNTAAAKVREQTGFSLSTAQREAVNYMTSGSDVAVLQGRAGTGKTASLAVAAEAWKDAGYKVRGYTPTGRAADELNKAGIESRTIASGKGEWRDMPFTSNDVVVVDEAGQVGSRDMRTMVAQARDHGAKVVLVGDERQLQPVAAGGAFREVTQAVGALELTEIRRQETEQGRETAGKLSRHEIRAAVQDLADGGNVNLTDTREEQIFAAVEEWQKNFDSARPGQTMILTDSNNRAHELNTAARAFLQERGELSRDEKTIDVIDPATGDTREIDLAEGDRVLFRRNDADMEVKNGDRGTVAEVGTDETGHTWVVTELDKGGAVRFSPDADESNYQHVQHGYAGTVDTSQGATVDHVVYAATTGGSAERLYVAASRHRMSVDIVAARDDITEDAAPTEKMAALVETVAAEKGLDLPEGYNESFQSARDFLDVHARDAIGDSRHWGELSEARQTFEAMATAMPKETTADYYEIDEPEPIARETVPDDNDTIILRTESEIRAFDSLDDAAAAEALEGDRATLNETVDSEQDEISTSTPSADGVRLIAAAHCDSLGTPIDFSAADLPFAEADAQLTTETEATAAAVATREAERSR